MLVVDDDPIMLEMLTRILARENYELLSADSGGAALQAAERHGGAIHLLITDYARPAMQGRELAERMRARASPVRLANP